MPHDSIPQNSLVNRLSRRLFGMPIVTNVWRGELVEEIAAMALEPEWTHCSGDYSAHDLFHPATGRRIQVKQGAAQQSWGLSLTAPRFSIAHKRGAWIDGVRWVPGHSRNADIFLFAWHALTGAGADHRDADQWCFYVIREIDLPPQKSISLAAIQQLTDGCDWRGLKSAIESLELR